MQNRSLSKLPPLQSGRCTGHRGTSKPHNRCSPAQTAPRRSSAGWPSRFDPRARPSSVWGPRGRLLPESDHPPRPFCVRPPNNSAARLFTRSLSCDLLWLKQCFGCALRRQGVIAPHRRLATLLVASGETRMRCLLRVVTMLPCAFVGACRGVHACEHSAMPNRG